jgi:manganese/zinc/iron transport system substrate-binding protein
MLLIRRPPQRAAATFAAIILAVGACDRSTSPATQPAGAAGRVPSVVCTIGMIADAAKNIGGPRVAVTALMGEGVDPHLYKASPGDVRLLSDADLILYNGLNLEGKMGDLFVKMAARKPTVAVTENIDPKLLREPPEFGGHYDPHVWFDVSLWMQAVERTRDALIALDPAGRDNFTRNTSAYLAQLQQLHEECRTRLAVIPKESRVLITAHDAFGYFGRAYDIEVLGLQGISTESEPSLKTINHLVDLIVERKVKAVFVESSVPRKNVEALVEGCRARGHEARIGGQLFSDAMGRAGTPEGTYAGMVRHNVKTIVDALK